MANPSQDIMGQFRGGLNLEQCWKAVGKRFRAIRLSTPRYEAKESPHVSRSWLLHRWL